ncbi:MAG: UDP-N-acetylmuramate dehydrogenase [Candidatus Thioglobus sp.]|nr:MAG: UDP-N-acetylmuramate dehydrogenase [Candidatus Thioglobus sp.]
MMLSNESMRKHCSLRAGGMVENLFIPNDFDELSDFLKNNQQPVLMLGLGSNLLVRDSGFAGTAIKLTKFNKLQFQDGIMSAGAGVTLAKLARFCQEKGLKGAEFLSAIPGSVGGALAMNAGAFDAEIWSFVKSVSTINTAGEVFIRDKSAFEIGYRSVKAHTKNEFFIKADLYFANNNAKQNIKDLLKKRNNSQPIGLANCGSVFKNPKGSYAAELIEKSGLKGFCIGGACVSDKHTNFIINQNNASSDDIEKLIKHIQHTVQANFDIELETEVVIIG